MFNVQSVGPSILYEGGKCDALNNYFSFVFSLSLFPQLSAGKGFEQKNTISINDHCSMLVFFVCLLFVAIIKNTLLVINTSISLKLLIYLNSMHDCNSMRKCVIYAKSVPEPEPKTESDK